MLCSRVSPSPPFLRWSVVGTVATALLITARTMPEGFLRPSMRNEITGSETQRDSGDQMRVQERRNTRLQENQAVDESATHEAASEETSIMPDPNDRRAYFRAERWCFLNGYANSRRLALCINRMVETGVFENAPW